MNERTIFLKEQHLICLDLDGTLLTRDQHVMPYTKEIIQKLKQEGHKVMIATGRPYRASEIYYNELDLDTPIVNFNGAFVHHPRNMFFKAYHEPLDLNVSREIFDKIQHLKIKNLIAEVKDHLYFHYHDQYLFDEFNMGNPMVTTGSLMDNLQEGPTSILIQAEEKNIPSIRQHLSDVYAESIEHRRWGAPFPIIEIVKKGINKAVGIEHVSHYYNIPQERIIAFGDEDNDNEMIEYAGVGVAMGNAIDDLKSRANFVTKSHLEDGIGHFLNQYFYE